MNTTNNGITVLSLFDGMSCGRIALERAGIQVDNYFASEVDKNAIKVSKANYEGIVQVGDVTKVVYKDGTLFTENGNFAVDKIDLLIGGSPCQGFSMAGKQVAFDDERSKLYFEYERILGEIRQGNPDVKFLLENVKMKQEYKDVISERLGVQPIAINSNLVSAQNRYRLYWTNIEGVTVPEDKWIFLKDILQDLYDDKYRIKAGRLQWLKTYGEVKEKAGYVAFNPAKAKCLTVRGEPSWNTTYVVGGYVPGTTWGEVKNGELKQSNIRQGNRVYDTNGKAPTLSSQGGNMAASSLMVLLNDSIVRKLTPEECEELQTVPSGYTNHVSDSQRYKMLGNGWTVDVIAHIFKNINNTAIALQEAA